MSLFSILWLVAAAPGARPLPVADFRIIPSESGKVNYYRLAEGPGGPFIHAQYAPATPTAVLGYSVRDPGRGNRLRWRWRALTLPIGANECVKGRGDSAAMLYVAWRSGLKWWVLKLPWSTSVPKGTRCGHSDGLFKSQETLVLESGPEHLGQWVAEELDLDAEYRRAFAHGSPGSAVPALAGIGLFTDGDQTGSPSAADFADFELLSSGA